MRVAILLVASLLGGCASSTVTLLDGEAGAPTGAVAVYGADDGAERGQVTSANTTARVGGRNVKVRTARGGRYADLIARIPYPPQVYVLYFEEGSTQIAETSRPILEALRKVVTADSEVQVTGHTDTTGAADFNDRLSYQRALEVRAALIRNGLPVESARVVGRGERELRVQTGDEVAEPANRRVEVILR
jgi:outer membrane protein OmpA-like peptidoglycan-associated protein